MIKYLASLPWRSGYFNQFVMAVMIIIPTTSFGMMLGWISPMQSILQSDRGPLSEPLTEEVVSWMASITFIVSVPLEFLMGYVADCKGRKFSILLTSASLVICWFIKLVCTKPWALILARGIGGIACAGCFVVTPMYIKEISDPKIRGALGSLLILSQNLGYLMMNVIGETMGYNGVMWTCFLIPTVHFVLFFLMPESPSFLVKQGRNEDAASVLSWLRCSGVADKVVTEELRQLQLEEQMSQETTNTWAVVTSIVTEPTTFKAFRISLAVMLAQECCGYLILLMYASVIFEKANQAGAGLTLSANQQTIMLAVMQLLGSIVASSVVEKTGRKLLLALSSFATGLGMLVLGGWFYLTSLSLCLPPWLPVLAVCFCIFSDAAGFQPTPFVIMSEMFRFRHRGMVTAILIAACSIADFVQAKTFDTVSKTIGIHSTFCFFSLLCFVGTVYTVLCVPETRDKTVDEIYEELGEKKEKKRIEKTEVCECKV